MPIFSAHTYVVSDASSVLPGTQSHVLAQPSLTLYPELMFGLTAALGNSLPQILYGGIIKLTPLSMKGPNKLSQKQLLQSDAVSGVSWGHVS